MKKILSLLVRDERGNITVMFLLFVTILFGFCAIGVDMGAAFIQKAKQDNLTQLACDEKMSPAKTLVIKNSSDPARYLSESIVETLRQNGFDGGVEIYYYEACLNDLGDRDRLYVYGVATTSVYESIFGGILGKKDVDISSFSVKSAHPYAGDKVWRPAELESDPSLDLCVCYKVDEGEDVSDLSMVSGMSFSDIPDSMQAEIEKRLNNLE